jgi:Ser/Thr protein kinase RdoA (MazF antagonist)
MRGWWFNLVLKIDAEGERLVLRRYGITPPDEVAWELAVLNHLAKHDFPTIVPLPRSDGSGSQSQFLGRSAILYRFVEGGRGCDVDWQPAMEQTVAAIARLHALTDGLVVGHARAYSGTEPRRMIRSLAAFAEGRGLESPPALAQMLDEGRRLLARLDDRLATFGDQLPRGVVHHDAHCENVLFRDGRLVALIDFDDAYEGFVLADVVRLMESWSFAVGSVDLPAVGKPVAVVREYERHRTLTDGERAVFPLWLSLFCLSDGSGYVQGEIERGRDATEAIAECVAYQRYQRLQQEPGWVAAVVRAL